MTTSTESILPLSEIVQPESLEALADFLCQASVNGTPVYPLGGQTCLHYGMPARDTGFGLDLTTWTDGVEHPARDLTITAPAGLRWSKLQELLSSEGQELPIDVPESDAATVGGVIATGWNGPRRLAHGSLRDYVIGIEAMDGQGRAFRGGGRVVKNVAGYDFCKLLTGSLGSLGVITQVTFKVSPIAKHSQWLGYTVDSWDQAAQRTEEILKSAIRPAVIGVASGPYWEAATQFGAAAAADQLLLAVRLEGLAEEVQWMHDHCDNVCKIPGSVIQGDAASKCLEELVAFPGSTAAPLVLRAKVIASAAAPFAQAVREIDSDCSLWCDLGTGTIDVHFSAYPDQGLSKVLVGKLQPQAAKGHGHVRMLFSESSTEVTSQVVWGNLQIPRDLMWKVKQEFDPANILNRDRFVW